MSDNWILEEIARNGAVLLPVAAPVVEWLAIIGNVALALRHPQNTGPSSKAARDFCKKLVAHLTAEKLISPAYAAAVFQDFAVPLREATGDQPDGGVELPGAAPDLPPRALMLLRRSEHVLMRLVQAEAEPEHCSPEAIMDGVHLLLRDLREFGIGGENESEAATR